MIKKIINSKFTKGLGIVSFGSGLVLYQTGYLEDVRYLIGGIFRGLRCAKVGAQVAYTYVYVIKVLIARKE
jgi:hypothetical protein